MGRPRLLSVVALLLTVPSPALAQTPPDIAIAGDWQIDVSIGGAGKTSLSLRPPEVVAVADERYPALPLFDPSAAPWVRGARLSGVRAFECTACGALDPAGLRIRSADGTVFERGKDYQMDDDWGTVGRLAGGRIGADQPVLVDYRYVKQRIDSVVRTKTGELLLRQGNPHIATPLPPALGDGESRLANIWLPGGAMKKIEPDHLFPILETAYPEPARPDPSPVERLLPNTLKKLREGGHLKILAWGDSVTDGGYLPAVDRWQAQFVARLKERYPKADIELVTEGWPGRTTAAYLAAPPGDPHNFREKVLAARPDLVVSEFVNDAGLDPAQTDERCGKILADFGSIGAEWIILTPHYVFPPWMGLARQRDIDDDPRPYVKSLREFASRRSIALADASLRYGRLWRQGLPYGTLMTNTLNHPDARGMKLFADSLMALLP